MASPPSFFNRLTLLGSALRWAMTGSAHEAQKVMAGLSLAQPVVEALVEQASADLDFFRVEGSGWKGDLRWALLLGPECSGGETGWGMHARATFAWQLGHALASDTSDATSSLFWAAVARASRTHRSMESIDMPGMSSLCTTLDAPSVSLEKVERVGRDKVYAATSALVGRALGTVYATKQSAAPPWEKAWSGFLKSPLSDEEFSVGVLLARLSGDSNWKAALPSNWMERLKKSPVPWPVWLALLDDGAELKSALGAPGGPTQWKGVSTSWRIPGALASSVNRTHAEFRGALKSLRVPPLVDAKGEVRDSRVSLVGLMKEAETLTSRVAKWGSVEAIQACAERGLSFDFIGESPLDKALMDARPFTALALARAGTRFGAEESPALATGSPSVWRALFESPLAKDAPSAWLEIEKAVWDTRPAMRRMGPTLEESALGIVSDATACPIAFASVHRLLDVDPQLQAALYGSWRSMASNKKGNRPVLMSLLTQVVQGSWPQEEKEKVVARVFECQCLTANAPVDHLEHVASELPKKHGQAWEGTVCRPVNALTWALVYAPSVVPALLARSTSSQIQEALDGAGSTAGWLEGASKGEASARGVSHSWRKWRPAWFQASLSVNPQEAFKALAAHPQARADLQHSRPTLLNEAPLEEMSGLDLMLWLQPTHVAAQALEIVGAVDATAVLPQALVKWVELPRDCALAVATLKSSGLLDAPATPDHGSLLHHAVAWQDEPLARALLEAGAQVDLPDKKGATPQSMASSLGLAWGSLFAQYKSKRLDAALPAPSIPSHPRSRM